MSRIFDALQRSKTEGVDLDFPLALEGALQDVTEMPAAAEPEASILSEIDLGQCRCLTIAPSPKSHLVSFTDQASLGAEKFRFLSVRLRHLCQPRSLKRVLITSTVPEEGKTMVSANLAVSLSQRREQKVLLLEGDLRRPMLGNSFGCPDLPGLGEWFEGGNLVPNIAYIEEAGLWFLPAGRAVRDPLELLQSAQMTELMDKLVDQFEWILIDSPPIAPLADVNVWTRMADGILMVARQGTTQKRQLLQGLQQVDQSKMLGVVLNGSNDDHHDNYYLYERPVK